MGYILGFTCITEGKGLRDGKVVDQKVATIFTGKSDLAGRLGDIPIIIELKTRPEIPEDSLEAQLYALGASQLMKSEKEIIVLHIYVSDNNASVKERKFGISELESAKAKFEDIAKKPASWIPFDALSPSHKVGTDGTLLKDIYPDSSFVSGNNTDSMQMKPEIKDR